ncbi:MAG: cellulase family glycosylhydrolase [Actinobacteria bacterium]|nr:cellulase family glycosylhydrolase [Actinomycetota bacterium]
MGLRNQRTWVGWATASVAMLLVAGCSSGSSDGASSDGSAQESPGADKVSLGVWSTACDDQLRPQNPCGILDSQGREWLFRGVNARIEGVFDVNFDDGREPLEPIPSFDASDTQAMQEIGFNLLRLPIQWSGIEPQPGQYDQEYIDRITEVIQLCEDAGIQVLVDMHQDAYSKEIGEDGAPAWAIVPPPTETNKGGELNLLAARLSKQTQQAFASFWKNEKVDGKGLQEYYIDAMSEVMKAVKDSPAVVGMEVFNEPWLLHAQTLLTSQGADPGLSLQMLDDFYAKAIPALREIAPDKLVAFGPDVAKNDPPALPPGSSDQQPYTAAVPDPIPWPTENTVYAPHFYTKAFFNPGEESAGYPNIRPDDPDITLNMNNSLSEAKQFSAPLLLGEFGFTEKAAQYRATLDEFYRLADENVVSSAQWVWKENSQDAWGFYDFVDGQPVLREKAADETARAYPQAVSGRIKTVAFDPATGAVQVEFVYQDTGAPHQVFVPVTYGYSGGFTLTCDGEEVTGEPLRDAGWLNVECGTDAGSEHTLAMAPKGE